MEKISEMIKRMCPEGIKRAPLGDLLDYEQPGKYIVKSIEYESKGIPVLTAGQSFLLGYTNETIGVYNASKNKPTIIFDDFTTSFHWVDFDFKIKSSAMKMLREKTDSVLLRYVYYSMYEILYTPVEHSRQWISTYSNFEIPLPPLPIQQEIVRILDSFTQLQSNLEAELVVRQKQYEFYRNKLFTFDKDDDSVERKTLGEISIDIFSGATPSTKIKEYWDGGTIPWMSSGEVHQGQVTNIEGCITELGYSKCSTKLVPINSVVIALAGQGKTRGTVAITRMSLCTNQSLAAIVPNTEIVNPDYLYFYLKGEYMNLRTVSSGDGTRGGLNLRMINEYKVPIVSIQRQQEIVSILDTFESLITKLKKEIEARKKQYEYYREQLLTFE